MSPVAAPRWWPAGAALFVLLQSCGSYGDFTLPPLRPSGERPRVVWEVRPDPVLRRGDSGEWDSADALNPSVVFRGGIYYNLYSGYDGSTWHTGLATSPDGFDWKKHGRVLSPSAASWEGDYIAANGHLEVVDGEFFYWYQAGDPPRIGLARSSDGLRWARLPAPVVDAGPRGAWDERGVADPFVLRAGGQLYMYYLGQDRARRQRLGVAESSDGVRWRKLRANPILDLGPAGAFDETGLGEPAVWTHGGRYWMLYTARDRTEVRRLGLATSADGVRWERVSPEAAFAGAQTWNAKVVCDPTLLPAGPDAFHVWFGGGDVAAPAENLNGQIGYARLRFERTAAGREESLQGTLVNVPFYQ